MAEWLTSRPPAEGWYLVTMEYCAQRFVTMGFWWPNEGWRLDTAKPLITEDLPWQPLPEPFNPLQKNTP